MLILVSMCMSEWKPLTLLCLCAWDTQVNQYCVFFVDLLDLFCVKVVIYALIGKATTHNLCRPIMESV